MHLSGTGNGDWLHVIAGVPEVDRPRTAARISTECTKIAAGPGLLTTFPTQQKGAKICSFFSLTAWNLALAIRENAIFENHINQLRALSSPQPTVSGSAENPPMQPKRVNVEPRPKIVLLFSCAF